MLLSLVHKSIALLKFTNPLQFGPVWFNLVYPLQYTLTPYANILRELYLHTGICDLSRKKFRAPFGNGTHDLPDSCWNALPLLILCLIHTVTCSPFLPCLPSNGVGHVLLVAFLYLSLEIGTNTKAGT